MIILILLGILIYQNLGYFMTTSVLKLDLKVASWNYTLPELQNIVYFGICFFLGLILAFGKGFISRLGLKKEIKAKEALIASLKDQVNTIKTELEVFQHDPYIKKAGQEETIAAQPVSDTPVTETPVKDTPEY